MPRGPRYLPPGWSVEVTTRTICGFFLLPATRHCAEALIDGKPLSGVWYARSEEYEARRPLALPRTGPVVLAKTDPPPLDRLLTETD